MTRPGLGRPTAWLTVGTLGGLILGLLQTPILFRALPAHDFGLWALGYGLGTAVATLDFGLGAATTRFMTIALAEGDGRRARTAYMFSLLLAAMVVLAGGVACLALEDPLTQLVDSRYVGSSSPQSFVWATWALMACYLLTTIGRYALAALSRFRMVGVWQLISQLAVLVTTAGVAWSGGDADDILWVTVAVAAVQGGVYAGAAARDLRGPHPGVGARTELSLREVVRFSAWMQLNGWNGFLNSQTDKIVITAIASTSAVAPFEAANTMARLVRVVPGQYLVALGPRMADVATEDEVGGAQAQVNRSLVDIARFTLPPTGLLVGLAPLLLLTWLGEIPNGAIVMVLALAVGNAVNVLTGPGTVFLRTVGRPRLEVGYGILQTFLNIGLSVALGLMAGAEGVVVATGVSAVIASAVFLVLFRRTTRIVVESRTKRFLMRMAGWTTVVATACYVVTAWTVAHDFPVVGNLAGLVLIAAGGAATLMAADLAYWRTWLSRLVRPRSLVRR
jgi:O-antigen/teichoic acid export membrane protein